ncbi:MAG TPA: divalent metal cation transporter [Solirubrobacteraceae bacterium]|nr:divalent metal cation transporter [Solirubrobacteraceae bacterium]
MRTRANPALAKSEAVEAGKSTRPRVRLPRVLRVLGPGLIAGASDNDPTTVATVAVVGSTTVYALGWVTVLIFPMLAVVQAIAGRVGLVTRRDLGAVVRGRYGSRSSSLLVFSVVCVTVLTLAADVKAGAAALGLLFSLDLRWFIIPLALAVLATLWLGSHQRVQRILKVVALVFLAYVVGAVAAHPNWKAVMHGSLIPSWRWNSDYTQGALALLGTTLTSYVYVWQTVEVAEDPPYDSVRGASFDAVSGAFFVVTIFWFVLVATGATLGVHHHQVQTAVQAASALRPVAGAAASAIFSIGLLASALLAVPVLMATSAYLISRHRRWPCGLSHPPRSAPKFYATMTAALALAVVIAFLGISPIHLLIVASIAGAIGTPVSLVFLLLVGRDPHTMGSGRVPRGLTLAGYLVAVTVTVFGIASLLTG